MTGNNIVESIRTVLGNRADLVGVYLFGSTARGTDHSLSDVDVAFCFQPPCLPKMCSPTRWRSAHCSKKL